MDELDDIVHAMAPVIAAFRKLGLRHFVGGSVASSFHGAVRSTMDVDIVAEIAERDANFLIANIGSDFYKSEQAIIRAIRGRSCFNLIHLPTSFKVDIFVSRQRPYDLEAMQRAVLMTLGSNRTIDVPIASPEDSIISKLEWYRLGAEQSERQWDDVSRLMKILGAKADVEYLNRAAESVGVAYLLKKLIDR